MSMVQLTIAVESFTRDSIRLLGQAIHAYKERTAEIQRTNGISEAKAQADTPYFVDRLRSLRDRR